MNDFTIFSPDSFQSMPWRNGLGVTVEILRKDLPDTDDFAWRLSMADVTEDGEFSNFSHYDRTLVLLEGKGMTLNCNGIEHRLSQPLQFAQFRGDDPTSATLHNGPIKDFNIMTHRDYCTSVVTASTASVNLTVGQTVNSLLIYAVTKDIQIKSRQSESINIQARHLMLMNNPDPAQLLCEGPAITVKISQY